VHDQKEAAPPPVAPAGTEAAKARMLTKLDKALEAQTRAADLLYDVSVDFPKDADALGRLLGEDQLERFMELAMRASGVISRAQTGASLATSAMAKTTTVGTAIDAASRVAAGLKEKLQREDDATCQCETCKRTRGRA
jgi:hypothetical protein